MSETRREARAGLATVMATAPCVHLRYDVSPLSSRDAAAEQHAAPNGKGSLLLGCAEQQILQACTAAANVGSSSVLSVNLNSSLTLRNGSLDLRSCNNNVHIHLLAVHCDCFGQQFQLQHCIQYPLSTSSQAQLRLQLQPHLDRLPLPSQPQSQTRSTSSMRELSLWARTWLNTISLDAAGLIALTDLTTIARRTALTGGASYADALTICPGIHKQGLAVKLHTGEYPICANMNSGYVFRVENQGTVQYLQRVGETGSLVTLRVAPDDDPFAYLRWFIDLSGPASSALLYLLVMLLTLFALAFMLAIEDYWGFSILLALVLSRFIMVVSIKRRCSANWHGASEPGVHGSLLVLLSQDRWVRIDGMVDDLKAVTSGQWLRDTGFTEEIIEGVASTSVYACAALGTNATQIGKLLIGLLLIVNAGLLALSNYIRKSQYMKERVIRKVGGAKPYKRRLELAYELIEEFDRDDWAVKMGMILEPVSREWLRARSAKDRKVEC